MKSSLQLFNDTKSKHQFPLEVKVVFFIFFFYFLIFF